MSMIIRVQSKDGTKRVSVPSKATTRQLLAQVSDAFTLNPGNNNWCLFRNRGGRDPLYNSSAPLSSLGIKHGEMLYLTELASSNSANSSSNSVSQPAHSSQLTSSTVQQDEIDVILSKEDGQVMRPRDPQLCHHGDQGRCVHCAPLSPFDPSYLASQEIKHMSFHTYLRKLQSGVDRGKFVFLENISCKLKTGCTEHPPWPNGICTKCQPSAVTLKRQEYRHIDNIEFENPDAMGRFLDYWRKTGHQRVAFMYGRYEVHKGVPLGIKAVVAAFYEPPQVSSRNSLEFLVDEREELVERIANSLGLRRVGWIFTDLVTEDPTKGTVKYFRNADSHFLSAQECINAADFQNRHPSPCSFSSSGYFGSKFSTVVVSGGMDEQISFEGYQVSNQCMALVRDDCFVPTHDAPELGSVRESSSQQYVPDVFFKEKDQYGSEVMKIARPLPVEYLLVQVPAAFPVDPRPMFVENPACPFPIENRQEIGETQDFAALMKYAQGLRGTFLTVASNFHFLVYLASCESLPVHDKVFELCEAVRKRDVRAAEQWQASQEWATVLQIMNAQSEFGSAMAVDGPQATAEAATAGGVSAEWECKHCTFLNHSNAPGCEVCGLPR